MRDCINKGNIIPNQYTRPDSEKYILDCQEVHNNFYNYDKLVLERLTSKVIITCPKHGDFQQVANKHRKGQGCPKCCNEWRSKHMSGTKENFVNSRTSVQKLKYNYDKVEFITEKLPVCITCKIHGDFWQTPSAHKKNKGCPECAISGYKSELPGFLYVLTCEDVFKIGITNRSGNTRVHEISTASQMKFKVVYKVKFEDGKIPQQVEQKVLAYLTKNYSKIPQKFNGSSECFLNVETSLILQQIEDSIKEIHDRDRPEH